MNLRIVFSNDESIVELEDPVEIARSHLEIILRKTATGIHNKCGDESILGLVDQVEIATHHFEIILRKNTALERIIVELRKVWLHFFSLQLIIHILILFLN